jgi:8-oxo-dGTP pyrophosphatase MutT (NUDIX family)
MGNICSDCEDNKVVGAIMPVPDDAVDDNVSASPTPNTATAGTPLSNTVSSIPPDRRVDYPLQVARAHTVDFNSDVTIDYSNHDYRAFCLLIHRQYGAILLHCTRKKKKPPHYQLPGGHVDETEFQQITDDGSTPAVVTQEQLYRASQMGCAREVYEETTIDVRQQLDRLLPMVLYNKDVKDASSKTGQLINEFKHRIFFVCEVNDDDFPSAVSNFG